ncbi:MAG: hypothetical protein WC655_18520 [Candidatus Hydrogenedentales bacterium]|jgi:hypothetical protein
MTDYSYTPETGFQMNTGFGFKTIWVIESLPDGDYRTGRELYDDTLVFYNIRDPELCVEFVEVVDRAGLFSVLQQVKSRVQQTGQVPLLHLEAHGDVDGLQLKHGEFITFEELMAPLRDINILVQNNLFVVVAACRGAHLIKGIDLDKRSPVWGFCGPSREISADDVHHGYRAFYEEAVTSANMNLALAKLKEAIPHCADHFHLLNSEYLFLLAYREYFTQTTTPQAIEERINRLSATLRAELPGPMDWHEAERMLQVRFGTEEGWRSDFERLKANFFFHDLYPAGASLPNPTYEDAMRFTMLSDSQ